MVKQVEPPDSRKLSDGPKEMLDEGRYLSLNGREAQRLAKRYGFAVFPVRTGTKHPLTSADKGGPGWEPNGKRWGATNSPGRIAAIWLRYPNADIGVATGGDLVVIDVDVKNGKNGFATLADLRLSMLPTLSSSTPSGGGHYYFRLLSGMRVQTKVDGLGPGVDVKADGGYVVAPSSVGHRPGRRSWVTHRAPAPVDRDLLDALQRAGLIMQPGYERPTRARSSPPPSEFDDLLIMDAGKGTSTDPNDTWAEDEDPESKLCFALAVIDPDTDYLDWLKIGAGIYHALGEAGLELWNEWSAGGRKYPGRPAIGDKWHECCKMQRVTVATVYHIADEHDRSWRTAYAEHGRRT